MTFNPFRVLNLPANATDEQIEDKLNHLLMKTAIGPERDLLLKTMQALSDPRRKFVYSLLRMGDVMAPNPTEDVLKEFSEVAEEDPLKNLTGDEPEETLQVKISDFDLRSILKISLEPPLPPQSKLREALEYIPDHDEPPPPSWEDVF